MSPCTRAERAKGSEPWRSFQRDEAEDEERVVVVAGMEDSGIHGLDLEVYVKSGSELAVAHALIREADESLAERTASRNGAPDNGAFMNAVANETN